MIPPGLSRLVKKVELLDGSTFFNVFFHRHKVGGQIAATNRRCAPSEPTANIQIITGALSLETQAGCRHARVRAFDTANHYRTNTKTSFTAKQTIRTKKTRME